MRIDALGVSKRFGEFEALHDVSRSINSTMWWVAAQTGLRIAYDAYKLSLGGKEAPVIDGLTGDQRFFIAFAASWKEICRPETVRNRLLSDVHTPAKFRVNGMDLTVRYQQSASAY